MKRALGIELRRGVGLVAALPLLVLGVSLVLAHPREWAGDWAGWSYYLRLDLLVYGPAVLAVGAWQGGRERRRGLVELVDSTPRTPLRRALLALVSPLGWAVGAYLVLAAAMAVVVARNTSYGLPLFGVVSSAVAAVMMFAALGYAVGRVSPWRITAPVLALVGYVFLGYLSYVNGSARYLSPSPQLFSGLLSPWWWPAASVAVFLLLGFGVLVVTSSDRRWTGVPVLGLAVLASVPILSAGQDAFTPDVVGQQLICSDGAPRVCLTRVHAGQLPQVAGAIEAALKGLGVRGPINEQQTGVRPTGGQQQLNYPTGGQQQLNYLYVGADLAGRSDVTVAVADAAATAVTWRCAAGEEPYALFGLPNDAELASATDSVRLWITNRSAGAEPGGVLSGLTDTEAVAVTRRFIAAAKSCDLPAARDALAAP